MTVLPEITGRLPVPDLLSASHPERLEAERRQRQEVVRLLGLGGMRRSAARRFLHAPVGGTLTAWTLFLSPS